MQNAAEYGALLAAHTSNHSDPVRHFGLHVLEHSIRYRWDELGDKQKEDLKTTVLELTSKVNKGGEGWGGVTGHISLLERRC